MAKIFLSMPILGKPELKSIYSLFQASMTSKEHQIRFFFNENDSLISRCRNSHISEFLDNYTDCDYFMSIDSDIEIVNAYPTNNIFNKLIEHDKDFVGGLYALKKQGQPECSSVAMDKRSSFDFDSGLVEMKWLSSGCWCIKRSAIEKMANCYPELIYDGDDNMSYKKVYGLYIPFIKEMEQDGIKFKKYLSEDWAFSARWKDTGGKIWADTSIALRHIGKHPYSLWNVSPVTVKKDTPINETEKTGESIKKVGLPPAGFDLNKE
jgi:hypothetical protein